MSPGGTGSDDVGGAVERIEEGRAIGVLYRAEHLADHDLLRPDVTVEHATSLLWVLTSFDAFGLLTPAGASQLTARPRSSSAPLDAPYADDPERRNIGHACR